MAAFRLVYRHPAYIALAVVLWLAVSVLYLWESQVLIVGASGVSLFLQPVFAAVALLIGLAFGLTIPMQIFAYRLAVATAAGLGRPVTGLIVGTASMTCCAPLLLPSLLSLLGFSGTTLLGLNNQLHRYFPVLVTLSVVLLSYSIASVVRSLGAGCDLRDRPLLDA